METTRERRADKVKKIFDRFDCNRDGWLNRKEMAALMVAVNPRVKFNQDQINAILDEIFRTYADLIDPSGAGLSLPGLIRTYDDGAGDVDRDFDALGLSQRPSETSSAAAPDHSSLPPPSSPGSATSAAVADVSVDDTWKLVNDLEILLKRLYAKQIKDGEIKGGSGDSGAVLDGLPDAARWSLGLSLPVGKKVVESGRDYNHFVGELVQLRDRADKARSTEEAFDGHMGLGQVLLDHHLYGLALASFRRACELKPTDGKAQCLEHWCILSL